jgi:hypothetical protein
MSALAELVFRLPNARAGQPYAEVLLPQPASGPLPQYLEITPPADCGLLADMASGIVSGTPQLAGELAIRVRYRLAGRDAWATACLIVNPDPKSLWRNLPSERSDSDWKADQHCASSTAAGFHILAASKRGRSHAHAGSFRDDDVALASLDVSGWQMVVVADGAGSACLSRRGAQRICEHALAYLQQALDGAAGRVIDQAAAAHAGDDALDATLDATLHAALADVLGAGAAAALAALDGEVAARTGVALKDFSSTALIALCKRYPFGTLCAAYQVGDGAIAVYGQGRSIVLLGQADSGEFAGQTRFLDAAAVTPEAVSARTRVAIVADMTALVVMSDGVSDPWFETEAALTRVAHWDAMWGSLTGSVELAGANAPQQLLEWLDFWAQGSHDDRTIALICAGQGAQ